MDTLDRALRMRKPQSGGRAEIHLTEPVSADEWLQRLTLEALDEGCAKTEFFRALMELCLGAPGHPER